MKVVIIGCGLIGRKRAMALGSEDVLVACCDTNEVSAVKFADEFGCAHLADYARLLSSTDFDIAIVAVVNKFAKQIVIDCLKAGKHVLAEKPLGRNHKEAREILDVLERERSTQSEKGKMGKWNNGITAEQSRGCSNTPTFQPYSIPLLKTGFNHRFHPAIWKAKELLDSGAIGKLFNIRAAYGHGGRPGMEREWRASKDLCGGGELLDQGVHVIDLIRWFGGNIKKLTGSVETKFWQMEVEDNAYVIARTEKGVTASFHVSWTYWKNTFSFEMFGTEGYLKILGLGGSYGGEILEIGRRKPEGGRPDIETMEFPSDDISWKKEWAEFKSAISEKRSPIGNGVDGLRANQVIDAIYRSSKENRTVSLQD